MSSLPFYRYTSWVGHITFAVLAVLALFFFKERTVILDAAFQSFEVIKRGWFAIQVNRFGAAMTQVFPLLGLKLKLPFPMLLSLYSVGFVLVHWFMFAICHHWLKARSLAFAIVLFNVFLVNNTFYWVQNEIVQSVSLCLLYWAIMVRLNNWNNMRWWHIPALLFLAITLSFFHPLTVFPFLFLAAYFLLYNMFGNKEAIQISLVLSSVFAFCAGTIVKYLAFPNVYDRVTIGRFSFHNIQLFFENPFGNAGFLQFVEHLPDDFYLLPVALATITVYYWKSRLYNGLIFVWASVCLYLIIVMISYVVSGRELLII